MYVTCSGWNSVEQSNCWVIVPERAFMTQFFERKSAVGSLGLHKALRLPVYGGQSSVADQLTVTVLELVPGASPVTEKLCRTNAGCHGPGGAHHVPGGGGTDGLTGPTSLGGAAGVGVGEGLGISDGEGIGVGLGATGVGLCS